MSGASGKVPAAIHLTPEALGGGPLAKVQDGDVVRLCAKKGQIEVLADLSARVAAIPAENPLGVGRELFALMRTHADGAEQGGSAMLSAAGL
jgi:phosphogluconate dehydratase